MFARIILSLAIVLSGLSARNCGAAIIYPKAPDGGQKTAIELASQFPRKDAGFFQDFPVQELTTAAPFRNYYVGLTNLVSGRLLLATIPGNWTYILMHHTNSGGAVDLTADEKTANELKATGLYQSNFSSETLEALRIAQQLPQIKKQDYEVRRLEIAPLLFVAVWLHGKSDNIIIPLPNTFGRWNAYQPYSEGQIVKLLKAEAEKKLKQPRQFD